MKTKLVWQPLKDSEGIALGIYGDKESIRCAHNKYYNHKITNAKNPIFMSENFAYIITDRTRLLKGLTLINSLKLQAKLSRSERVKLFSENGQNQARQLAQWQINNIPHEVFLRYGQHELVNYPIGNADFDEATENPFSGFRSQLAD